MHAISHVTSARVARLLDSPTLPALVVHGGAWTRAGEGVDPPIMAGLDAAARAGWAVLNAGGSALDAVEAAVVCLEEDPVFNAGRGSCLTRAGTVEMDASVMWGPTLEAGAVANVHGVRNPIRLAREIMASSGHLLLAGEGALQFAQETGLECVDPLWHVTTEQRLRWEELQADYLRTRSVDTRKLGTVGCVAVDLQGRVAAGTSTGGTAFKRPGRVGDSPIIGAGTWADDRSGGVSCTGHGESILRVSLARWTADLLGQGVSPRLAAEAAAEHLSTRVGGDGGLIVGTPDGRLGWAMNTPRMSRALMRGGMDAPLCLVDP